jgi:hypothetical protein
MKIGMAKAYRTRKGDPYRVLCTDAPGLFPVVGILMGIALLMTTRCTE